LARSASWLRGHYIAAFFEGDSRSRLNLAGILKPSNNLRKQHEEERKENIRCERKKTKNAAVVQIGEKKTKHLETFEGKDNKKKT
jgi:hypothetical protein